MTEREIAALVFVLPGGAKTTIKDATPAQFDAYLVARIDEALGLQGPHLPRYRPGNVSAAKDAMTEATFYLSDRKTWPLDERCYAYRELEACIKRHQRGVQQRLKREEHAKQRVRSEEVKAAR